MYSIEYNGLFAQLHKVKMSVACCMTEIGLALVFVFVKELVFCLVNVGNIGQKLLVCFLLVGGYFVLGVRLVKARDIRYNIDFLFHCFCG